MTDYYGVNVGDMFEQVASDFVIADTVPKNPFIQVNRPTNKFILYRGYKASLSKYRRAWTSSTATKGPELEVIEVDSKVRNAFVRNLDNHIKQLETELLSVVPLELALAPAFDKVVQTLRILTDDPDLHHMSLSGLRRVLEYAISLKLSHFLVGKLQLSDELAVKVYDMAKPESDSSKTLLQRLLKEG